MTTAIKSLREELGVPPSGPIDFHSVLGTTLTEALDRWRKGHIPMPRKTVHNINFDEPSIMPSGAHCAIIDSAYKVIQGIEFLPYRHTYDWATAISGFEPAQGRYVGYDQPVWYEPHVYAVADRNNVVDNYSISKPRAVNVGDDAFGGPTQLLSNDNAIRINFDSPVCTVQMASDYRISHKDQGKPIWNWPQMFAYDSGGNLLHQDEAPYGGELMVSSWAGDIAYVIVTVNNHYAGVEPRGIFDDLRWTTIEFVLRSIKKMRQAPAPVPRSALIDQVIHRIAELQVSQRRLQKRFAKVTDAELAAQLHTDLATMAKQTDGLLQFYRKITKDTANRTSVRVTEVPEPV